MNNIKIQHKQTGAILYQGSFKDIKECVERAVREGISLCDANLTYLNLSCANLDDADLDGADFTGSNLIGANLSEASLNNAIFTHCSLESACFAYSALEHADFTNCQFGGTYIEGAVIDGALFSAQSCFHLEFVATASMNNCRYRDENGHEYTFSHPPLLLHGLSKPVVLIGQHIKIGSTIYYDTEALPLKSSLLHDHRSLITTLLSCAKQDVSAIRAA